LVSHFREVVEADFKSYCLRELDRRRDVERKAEAAKLGEDLLR
jgi:hypothetical protein